MSKNATTPRAIRREQERKEKKLTEKTPQESTSIIDTAYSEVHKKSYAEMLKEVEEVMIQREKIKEEKSKAQKNKEQEDKEETSSPREKLKYHYEVFIQEMVEHGQQRKAYMAAYPDCSPHSADTGAGRLMEKPGIRTLIEMGRAAVNEQRQQLRRADAARQIADLQQKHETLQTIYSHEWHKKQTIIKNGNEVYMIKVTEDPMVRLNAIKEDAKVCMELIKALEALAAFPELAAERISEKEAEKLNITQHTQHLEAPISEKEPEKLNITQHFTTELNIPLPSPGTSDSKERVKGLPDNEIKPNDINIINHQHHTIEEFSTI